MVHLRSEKEIGLIRESARIVAGCLQHLRAMVRPGLSTLDLDQAAREFIEGHGGRCAFKGYRGYPAHICTSVNAEVVHGIPSAERRLQEGDVVSLDVGVQKEGYFGDAALSVPVGEVAPEVRRLLETTEAALAGAVEQARAGNRLGDVGHAVQSLVEGAGFSVVRALVGHGIGREMHEEPQVPNYGMPGRGPKLLAGMVLAIEPMVNIGGPETVVLADGWTVVTQDGKPSAHFEHTVAVTADGPVILSRP
ncbi:MAG TPA: type I methionyl aminopeptidase [Candidatus Saccharimonadales bacterium]|nr:type I methionyl aminopeptidase [Candidatus Saccharimonadales bacterium]